MARPDRRLSLGLSRSAVLQGGCPVGYLADHVLTGDPITVAGCQVLGLMTGLGLAGLAGDVRAIRRQAHRGLRGAAWPAPGLDRFLAAAAILALAAYVLIVTGQLDNYAVLISRGCYIVRDPLDLAVAAGSVFGGAWDHLCSNARRSRLFLGASGTLALAGALAGLAAQGQTQVSVATGGLIAVTALSLSRWRSCRSAR